MPKVIAEVIPLQAIEAPPHPRTELGKKLWKIRRRSIANGLPLLDAEEIAREVQLRRGGQHDKRL